MLLKLVPTHNSERQTIVKVLLIYAKLEFTLKGLNDFGRII